MITEVKLIIVAVRLNSDPLSSAVQLLCVNQLLLLDYCALMQFISNIHTPLSSPRPRAARLCLV